MRRYAGLLALVVLLPSIGCVFGKTAAKLPMATSPTGAVGVLWAMNKQLRAELIEVRDDGAVFLDTTNRLILLPYRAIQLFRPDNLPGYLITRGQTPAESMRQQLKSVSHFPQGMTPEIKRKMLERVGQTDFVSLQ